jgi:hypothetical protein
VEEVEDGEMLPEQNPAVSLEAAREAADTVARFIAENADKFGMKIEIEFVFERRVSVPRCSLRG